MVIRRLYIGVNVINDFVININLLLIRVRCPMIVNLYKYQMHNTKGGKGSFIDRINIIHKCGMMSY